MTEVPKRRYKTGHQHVCPCGNTKACHYDADRCPEPGPYECPDCTERRIAAQTRKD